MQLSANYPISDAAVTITFSLSDESDHVFLEIALPPFHTLRYAIALDWDLTPRDAEALKMIEALSKILGTRRAHLVLEEALDFARIVYTKTKEDTSIAILRDLAKSAHERWKNTEPHSLNRKKLDERRNQWLESHNTWIRAAMGR